MALSRTVALRFDAEAVVPPRIRCLEQASTRCFGWRNGRAEIGSGPDPLRRRGTATRRSEIMRGDPSVASTYASKSRVRSKQSVWRQSTPNFRCNGIQLLRDGVLAKASREAPGLPILSAVSSSQPIRFLVAEGAPRMARSEVSPVGICHHSQGKLLWRRHESNSESWQPSCLPLLA
jgi:hypothetical protein